MTLGSSALATCESLAAETLLHDGATCCSVVSLPGAVPQTPGCPDGDDPVLPDPRGPPDPDKADPNTRHDGQQAEPLREDLAGLRGVNKGLAFVRKDGHHGFHYPARTRRLRRLKWYVGAKLMQRMYQANAYVAEVRASAATDIARWWRLQTGSTITEELGAAATFLQRCWRGYLVRREPLESFLRRRRILGRFLDLFGKLVVSEAMEAIPSTGDGPDSAFLDTPCNGHRNEWAAAVCPCQRHTFEIPRWLRGKERDDHDHANCTRPWSGEVGHDESTCTRIWRPRPVEGATTCRPCGPRPGTDPAEELAALAADSAPARPGGGDSHHEPCPNGRRLKESDLGPGEWVEAPSAEEEIRRSHRNYPRWWRFHPRFRRYLRHGVLMPWRDGKQPPRYYSGNYSSADHWQVYREFAVLRAKGFLDGPFSLEDRDAVRCVQPVGGVEKKDTDRLRVIIDFSRSQCNAHLEARPFGLPNLEDALRHVRRQGTYGALADLADAFLHVPTHPLDRPCWAVEDPTPPGWVPPADDADAVRGQHHYTSTGGKRIWRYTSTGFGCALSPYFWCTMINHLTSAFRAYGIPIEQYVDDALVLGRTAAQCGARVRVLRAAWSYLGLREKPSKYEPPSQQFQFLGMRIDSVNMMVRIPDSKKQKLLARIREFRQDYSSPGATVPRKELASLVGKLTWASGGIRHGRVYTRRMQRALHNNVGHLTLHQRIHLGGTTILEPDFWQDLEWWEEALPSAPGRRFFPDRFANAVKVFGDASSAGYGATWYSAEGPRSVSVPWALPMRYATSNLREITTFERVIDRFGSEWADHSQVLYTTDNLSTAKALNSGYTSSDQMMDVVRRVHQWAAQRDITLSCRWISGKAIIKEGSDGLSRAENFPTLPDPTWELAPGTAAHWAHVSDSPVLMPRFRDTSRVIRAALEQYELDPVGGACTIIAADWGTSEWWQYFRRFRSWYRYEPGARIIRKAGQDTVHATRHPLVVLRLPRPGEPKLTRKQRRHARDIEG